MSEWTLDQVKRELRNIADAIDTEQRRKREQAAQSNEKIARFRKAQQHYNEMRKELIRK